ncbi:uncharacterized protein LOC124672059 [Lolium rigidum]|uniref:uncharacterized protein LOC124672059 n=1 Tax=Lolium rigidum TaxID=89674 RepID=UPI001F5CE8A1|nr:uncharacterized protein LOC124672059 [Lolium rigidum]
MCMKVGHLKLTSSDSPPPATGPRPCLSAAGLDGCLLLQLPPGEWIPRGTRGGLGDPAGCAKGGGGADLVSTGSAAVAATTGIRWLCVGLLSATDAVCRSKPPPTSAVFNVPGHAGIPLAGLTTDGRLSPASSPASASPTASSTTRCSTNAAGAQEAAEPEPEEIADVCMRQDRRSLSPR